MGSKAARARRKTKERARRKAFREAMMNDDGSMLDFKLTNGHATIMVTGWKDDEPAVAAIGLSQQQLKIFRDRLIQACKSYDTNPR